MGKLIYAANTSLDGFLEDETGSFDWSVPDEEVHAFWNEHERQIGTSLYGRRMYETMRVWESDDWLTNEPAVVREYAARRKLALPDNELCLQALQWARFTARRSGRSARQFIDDLEGRMLLQNV